MKGQEIPLILIDIDDNLCHTTKKFRRYVGDENEFGQACVFDPSGKPLSFRSSRQTALLDWLSASATILPVTGRSREKFQQVCLGFAGHAIVSFGALILLPDGSPDPGWFNHIKLLADRENDVTIGLLHAATAAAAAISSDLNVSVISDTGINLLIKVQHVQGECPELVEMGKALAPLVPQGWTLHVNEGQLCAYPPFLGKEKACSYFLENLAAPYSLLIGSGDSITDLSFANLCDFMLAPTQSQIFRHLLKNNH